MHASTDVIRMDTMDTETMSRTVYVTSIPDDIDRDILEVSLENRRYNGGDIDDLQLNTDEGTAFVTFADAEVATRLLAIGYVDIDGHRLLIVAPPVAEPPNCTVYVYDVPANLCDRLRDFMESKRLGGGQIDTFDYDEQHHAAIVTFHQSEIAEKFIAKESIQLKGQTFIVSQSAPGSSDTPVTVTDGSQTYCDSAPCVADDFQVSPEMENDNVIYVHNVPEDLKEIVYSYVENQRHGGGDVHNFQFVGDGSFARFAFADVNVAKRFKEQKELNIDGIDHMMYVSDSPPPASNTADNTAAAVDIDTTSFDVQSVTSEPDSDAASRTVFIENVPDNMLQFLEPVLESKKAGGGPIESFEEQDGGALVTFQDLEVAQQLLSAGQVIFGSTVLKVVAPPAPAAVSESDSDAASRTVFIENIPADMLQFIEPVLESKKAGGGPIESFEEQDGGALVTFQDVEVAQQLLSAGQVVFGSTVLKVVAPRSENNAVLVSGIPRSMSRDLLLAFLESSRINGGEVLDVEYRDGQETATVRFQDPQVAKRLLDAGCIQYKKSVLQISSVPADNNKVVASDVADAPPSAAAAATADNDDGDSDSYEDAPTEPEVIDTIEVRNIPEKLNSQNTLTMFFENKRRSGGGEITNVVMTADNNAAFITFKDPNIARSLIAKQEVNHNGHIVHILKPVTQQRQQQQQQPTADSPVDDDDTTKLTIQIIGIPATVKRDTLVMYLENAKKSGGGPVCEYEYIEGSGKATVSFEDNKIAEEMLHKGKLTYLGGQVLTVVKPKPLQCKASAKSTDNNSIQIAGIPADIKSQTLLMYLENKRKSGGGEVDQFEYIEGSGTATISFKDNHVAQEMLRKGQLTYLGGQTLTVVKPRLTPSGHSASSGSQNTDDQWSPTAGGQRSSPRTIQVTGLGKEIKKDQLGMYFEHRRSCGGPVADVQLLDDCAFVTFVNADDALRVAKKTNHVLFNVPLSIELLDTWPQTTSCAIKVQGFNPSATQDAIEMYFENTKRTGGDEIEELFYDSDKRVAFITYKSRDVAGRVAKHSDLSLNGAALTVEWLKPGRPPPVCLDVQSASPDTLLFTELPTNIESNGLKKFACLAAGISVSNVTFSPRPGVALVTFQGYPDYERVRQAVCSRPCRGQMVSVQRLQQSTAIQVHNVGTVNQETIELYFENKKSGGGTIQRIEPGAGYFIVEFEDKQVINQVVCKPHAVSGQKLQVQPYFPSFGVLPPGFDSSRPLQPLPPDVEVACAPEVAGFIATNKQLKHKIEEIMKNNSCFIKWPRVRTDKLVLHCNINPQQPGAFPQLKNWSERCTAAIQKELEPIIFIKEEILQELWKQLREKVEAGAKCNPQEILVHWEDGDGVVYACGIRNHVQNFQAFVRQVKNGLEADLERSKKRITENVILKPHQMYLLRTTDLNALSRNRDIKVSFSDTGLTLIGQSADVRQAKLELLQKVSGITSSSLDSVSSGQLKLLNRSEYKAHIHRMFQQKKLPVTFDIQNSEVMVYGFESRDVDDAVALMKSEVSEMNIPLNGKCVGFVRSKTWNDFLSELSRQFKVADITVSGNSINITATDGGEAQAIGTKIQEFLEKTVIIEEFISIPPGAAKVLKNYAEHQMDRLQHSIRKYRGEVKLETSSRFGCTLKINLGGLLKAKQDIAALVQNVKKKDHNILPNFVQFLLTYKGRVQVQGIASENNVVVHYPEDEVRSAAAASHKSFDPYVFSETTTIKGKLIRLVVGDIVKYPADVVVNAANSRLDHGSGVAGAIAKLGGPALIAECDEYVKQHGQLRPGKVFKSSPGDLPFKAVIHTVGPIWRHGTNNEDRDLRLAVESALKESDKLNHKSVSLPAISCGIYGFPVEQGTELILKNVMQFLERSTSVNDVYIVSGRQIILKFQETLARMVGKDKIKIEDKRSSDDAGEESGDDEPNDANCSDSEYDKVPDFTATPSYQPASTSFRTAQGLTITLIKGSIVSVKADAIFNTTEKDLDLNKGIVSKSILAQAGNGLQDECRTQYPQGVNVGHVIKTGAHKLPFKWIYHGVPRKWDSGTGDSEKVMRMLVKSTLNFSAADGLQSVAFPAIGTGNLRIPHNVVARGMFDEVTSFSAANGNRISLRDVYFVLYDRDHLTIDAFECELQRHCREVTGSSSTQDASNRSAAKQNIQKLDCFIGDVKLQVKSGDITKERCDAIVNSTNDKLDLRYGVLSKAIVSAGGESIVDECRKLGGAPKGWAVTSGGRLPCRYMFHLVAKKDVKSWKAIINTCFAEAEKMQITSIAMPPLGTGRSGAGEGKEIAEAILEEVAMFANSKPQWLKNIIITVHQHGMVEQFVSAAENVDKLDKHNPLWKSCWEKVKGIKDRAVTYFTAPSSGSKQTERPRGERHLKPGAHRPLSDNKFVLSVYGLSMSSIDAAIRDVDKMCKESKKVIELKSEDVKKTIGVLTPDEEKSILLLEKQFNVSITLVKPAAAGDANAKILVDGDNENTGAVVPEIYNILMKVKDREKELELLANQAVWEYASGQVYKVYDVRGRGMLEKAFTEKKSSVEWEDSSGKHIVSISNFEDTCNGIKVAIRRHPQGTMALPSDWTLVPQGQSYIDVDIPSTSSEFTTVQNNLKATANNAVKTVVKIQRIQNPFLYRQYMAKKEELDRINPGGQNEMRLWHGTAGNNITNISKNNFNRSYGGVHGLAIGKGVYFAVSSYYSISGYSQADASGMKYIYQARVLVGKSTLGKNGMLEPPAGYDSVTDGANSMFVVFYDAQTYPEYLITFQ